MMNKPIISEKQVVYRNQYKHVYQVQVDFGDYTKEYFVTDGGVRTGMVAVRNDTVLLVRQYRFLLNDLSWEIPGGGVDAGEEPVDAAIRECLEEAGVRCLNPRLLINYHVSLDTTHNPTFIFFSDEIATAKELDKIHANEVSYFEWVPFERCLQMMARGEINDSFSLVALLTYQHTIRVKQIPLTL